MVRRTVRRVVAVVSPVLWVLAASPASAQAPPTGPLVLHVPASARVAALGDAWVAGRDHDVVFANPAQLIGVRPGFDLSITRLSSASTMVSSGSIYAAGPRSLTFGWGAKVLRFSAAAATSYPYSPDILLGGGSRNGTGVLLTAGAAMVLKGFRVGVAGKYVSDMTSLPPALLNPVQVNKHRVVADVGVARNVLGGTAAVAFQNIGRHSTRDGTRLVLPRQVAIGFSRTRQLGPLDLAGYGQVTLRKDWTAPAGGLEVGYSWIEGYNVVLRIGARRPETKAEQPVALGAGFTADRLTVEYAVRFFEGGRTANGVTLRWR